MGFSDETASWQEQATHRQMRWLCSLVLISKEMAAYIKIARSYRVFNPWHIERWGDGTLRRERRWNVILVGLLTGTFFFVFHMSDVMCDPALIQDPASIAELSPHTPGLWTRPASILGNTVLILVVLVNRDIFAKGSSIIISIFTSVQRILFSETPPPP